VDLTLSRLGETPGPGDDAALIRQRQVLRLAHATTPPRYLMAAAPPDLVLEDVPRRSQAYLGWLRAMSAAWASSAPCDATDPAVRAWVSCHTRLSPT
jgi:hypothetical protein